MRSPHQADVSAPLQKADVLDSPEGNTAKAICDLDKLIQALLSSVPTAKPWQRQLRRQLEDCDGLVQVLRITILMERGDSEVRQAAEEVFASLRLANTSANAGRTDMGTRHAIKLAAVYGQRVSDALRSKGR